MKNYAKDYTLNELMAVTCTKEINDFDVLIAGIGIPTLAASVASMSHAPHIVVTTEWGTVAPNPRRLMYSVTDSTVNERAVAVPGSQIIMNDMQAGLLDLGVLGGAQVDKYGNVNSSRINDPAVPGKMKTLLPGSGGANDIATSAEHTIIIMRSTKRCFVEKVDYVTSPGFIDGPGARERCNMPGKGPKMVLSAEGTFRFDPGTKEMYLDTYHPGLSVEEVKAMIPWNIPVSPDVRETEPPTVEQITLLRMLDPTGMYLGNGRQILGDGEQGNFDVFLGNMMESFDSFEQFIKHS